jgi:hypothetical protein
MAFLAGHGLLPTDFVRTPDSINAGCNLEGLYDAVEQRFQGGVYEQQRSIRPLQRKRAGQRARATIDVERDR